MICKFSQTKTKVAKVFPLCRCAVKPLFYLPDLYILEIDEISMILEKNPAFLNFSKAD